ncbi:MAG TPA: tetratricopeptide repeat protein, partial [bacterium]|nr:tetratricopeptide repeat protein [bacterium]
EFYDRQLTFTIGRHINSNSGLGLSLNMFQEKIDDKTKQTFFLNIGYRNYFYKNLVYGVTIRNIGPAIKYYKDKTDLPAMISNGIYFQPEISFLPALCLEFNYERNNDASLITALIFNFEKYINVYLSYSNYSKIRNKLNGGISISYKNFDLCYGYQNIEDFGDLHSFNISLKFATKVREKKEVMKLKPVEKNIEVDETKLYYNLLKTGQENLENKRFDEALFYFEKAIELKEDKNIELYRKIGDIYFQKKDYTKAKEFYDKYLEKIKKEGD